MVRTLAAAVVLFSVATLAAFAWSPESAEAQQPPTCGTHRPYNFNTFELPANVTDFAAYKTLINLAAEGKLFPNVLTAAGETVDVRYQGLEAGPRNARSSAAPTRRIPPTIYYSIAWQESRWANATNAVPWGGVGAVLRSFDCGFGIGQITTGMANSSGTPTAKQALIGIHPAFNIAEGMRILAEKWNAAPAFRPIAGKGDPSKLEDWYYAIWGYNGFAWVNHPFHPRLDPLRGGSGGAPIDHCWDPSAPSYVANASGNPVYAGYGDYTYPEIVYGCMRHPPIRNGQRMWAAVDFSMPDFRRPEIAAAFDVRNWDCISSGCPKMDYPTSFPDDGIEPREDIVPPTNPSQATRYLGSPSVRFNGPSSANLQARPNGSIDSVTVTATNTGSFIAPFRIRTTAPWLVVTDKNGSQSRYLDGNLAIGSGTQVVVTNNPTRVTKQGHVAEMNVTLNKAAMPRGPVSATVYFEPLYGGGQTFSVTVTGTDNSSPPPTPTPRPSPTPTPPPPVGDPQLTIPGLSANR